MSKFTDNERAYLHDLLHNHVDEEAVYAIAKSLAKNAIPIDRPEDAYDVIFLHGTDARTILNKRHVTRDILFKYLHRQKIPIQTDFTKLSLIEKVLQLWNDRDYTLAESSKEQPNSRVSREQHDTTEDFPINLMARQFTGWFFNRYNADEIIVDDFWIDATLEMITYFEDGIDNREASTSAQLVETLLTVKNDLKLFFNASTLHRGSQGRIDVHGLVLVLSCGTIHTPGLCVGVFECIFKLTRDPFAENNWKIKGMHFVLKSKMNATTFSLEDSESMQKLLCLPAPSGDV